MIKKTQKHEIRLVGFLPRQNIRRKKITENASSRCIIIPKISMRFKLHLHATEKSTDARITKKLIDKLDYGGPIGSKSIRKSLAISGNDIDQLYALNDSMLKWIEKDKLNAAMFIADPINALARMGLKNEKILLKKLRYLNTKNRSIKMPRAKISSIVVETSTKTVKDAVEGM